MEVEEIQASQQPCSNKFPRLGNGSCSRATTTTTHHDSSNNKKPGVDEDDASLDLTRAAATAEAVDGGSNRLRRWHHSRIIRVARATGGKDRHSKVWTSKGLRDRRVRLSVTTAIEFFDLQDRLGCDQPSKAVEWLIKAAADAISELPSLNNPSFPDTPKQLSDEKRGESCEGGFDSAEVQLDRYHQSQSQHLSLSKSACSSTSETSKGSGLSLSRSEIRVNRSKARERARERAAKDKEKETDINNTESAALHHHQNDINNNSFTELLTAGIGSNNSPNHGGSGGSNEPMLFHKAAEGGGGAAGMDYFSTGGLLGLSNRTYHSSGFTGQIYLGMNSIPQTMSYQHHHNHNHHNAEQQLHQHFSFVPDHLIPVTTSSQQPGHGGGDYNLNFPISSSSSSGNLNAGCFDRGTLQSNYSSSTSSPSTTLLAPHHHLQRFSTIDGSSSNIPFFIGAAAPAAALTMENHHNQHHQQQQFPSGFDHHRLQQLYGGEGTGHSDLHKGKAKN